MDLGNTKVKDLGKAAKESIKEAGRDVLDKTEEEIEELKEKMYRRK